MNAGLLFMGILAVIAIVLAFVSHTKKGQKWLLGGGD